MAVIQTAESGRRAAYIKEFMFDKKKIWMTYLLLQNVKQVVQHYVLKLAKYLY